MIPALLTSRKLQGKASIGRRLHEAKATGSRPQAASAKPFNPITKEISAIMPIYEFRCIRCGEYFEVLVMNQEEAVEMKCARCGGEDIERVMSKTSYSMGTGTSQPNPSAQTRTCSSGSCTTIDLPGHSR